MHQDRAFAADDQSLPGTPHRACSAPCEPHPATGADPRRSQRPPSPAGGHPHGNGHQPVRESAQRVPDRMVDPRPAHIHRETREVDRMQPAPDPITRLHHHARGPGTREREREQPGHPGSTAPRNTSAAAEPNASASRPSPRGHCTRAAKSSAVRPPRHRVRSREVRWPAAPSGPAHSGQPISQKPAAAQPARSPDKS